MKLEDNISIWDLLLSKSGSINNIIEFIESNNFENLNQNLLGVEFQAYSNNLFSQNLKFDNRLISTKNTDYSLVLSGGSFSDGFSDGFDI